MHSEGKKPEGRTITKAEGMAENTAKTAIKREMKCETKVNKKDGNSRDD